MNYRLSLQLPSILFKRLANQRGFDITDAYCDNEATFGAVSRTIPGMVIHHTASRGHEKVIERHTRFLKERCRAVLAGLPYDLPNVLVVPLVEHVVYLMNLLPRPTGLPISPREAFTGKRPNLQVDLRITFGE